MRLRLPLVSDTRSFSKSRLNCLVYDSLMASIYKDSHREQGPAWSTAVHDSSPPRCCATQEFPTCLNTHNEQKERVWQWPAATMAH